MLKKTNIFFLLPNLTVGGAERVTLNYIEKLDRKKFNITLIIFSNRWSIIEELPKKIKIVRFNASKTIYSIIQLRKIILKKRPDIVFTSLIRSNIALYLAMLGVKSKPKIILRSPSSPKLMLEEKYLSLFTQKLLDLSYKHADKIIAQTPEMKEELLLYNTLENEKIEVVFNPLDIEMIEKKISHSSNPFDETKINVIAAGRLSPEKGFDTLIHAFRGVVEKNSKFILTIIGANMGEEDKLKKLVTQYKLVKHVFFLGHQNNPYQYYQYSDLFVLSSRREGLPNTILENLYLGKPIVATRCIPFMDTMLNDKKNGFLVDVDDIATLEKSILDYEQLSPDNSFLSMYTSDISLLFETL